MEDQPEPKSASTPPIVLSSLTHPLTHPPSSPSTDDVPEIASTLSSVLLTNLECVPLEMVDQPEFEPEHASLSSITLTSPSLPVPLLALEFTNDIRVLSSLPLPETSTLNSLPLILSPDQSPSFAGYLSQLSSPCELELTPMSAVDIVTLSHPELPLLLNESILFLSSSLDTLPNMPISPRSMPLQQPPRLEMFNSDSSPLEIPLAPANLAPSPLTFVLIPIFSASSDLSSALPSPPLVLGNLELEFFPTPSSAVKIVPLSSMELSKSTLSLHEPFPFLPTSPEASPNAPILPHLMPPQLPKLKTISLVSTQLEVTPSPASPTVPPVPRQVTMAQWLLYLDPQLPEWQELLLVHEVSSIKPLVLAPHPSLFHSSPSLRLFGTSIRFGFTLALVTTAVLASILNIPATISTFAHKYWSKQEDIGNNRIGTLNTSTHFIFDPGGQSSSSSVQVPTIWHTKTFTSASQRYATASSRTSPSPFLFQSTILFSIPEVSSLTRDGQDFDPPGGPSHPYSAKASPSKLLGTKAGPSKSAKRTEPAATKSLPTKPAPKQATLSCAAKAHCGALMDQDESTSPEASLEG
ncbi:hypothetical protein EDB83DRAFT_2327316 [Lactarius deliciosus]|nr:hypothetical protein EDB83DRAFT_2327316 [Lactarius deliciosus]